MTNGTKQAFASVIVGADSNGVYQIVNEGLTKREYFAAAALTGLLPKEGTAAADKLESVSRYAVMYADALIDALNKQGAK